VVITPPRTRDTDRPGEDHSGNDEVSGTALAITMRYDPHIRAGKHVYCTHHSTLALYIGSTPPFLIFGLPLRSWPYFPYKTPAVPLRPRSKGLVVAVGSGRGTLSPLAFRPWPFAPGISPLAFRPSSLSPFALARPSKNNV